MDSIRPSAASTRATEDAHHAEDLNRLEVELMLNPARPDLRRQYLRLIQSLPAEDVLQRAHFANYLRAQAISARFPTRVALAIAAAGILLIGTSGLPLETGTSHLLRSAGCILLGSLQIAVILWFRWYKLPLRLQEETVDYYKQPLFYHLALLLGLFFGTAFLVGPFLGPR